MSAARSLIWASRIARLALLALVTAFAVGLVVFGGRVAGPEATFTATSPKADAIVALTGGGGARIKAGMAVLSAGGGARLLISGVHPDIPADDVNALAGGDDAMFACCVDLGRTATSTMGNAAEVAAWARAEGYASLIVVTSDFHMPRSLIAIRAAAPGVTLIPHPVPSAAKTPWWRDAQTWRRVSVEYVKYLVMRVNPPRAAPAE